MPRIKQVEIQFGGEARHLIYDFNALAELQDIAGTYQSNVAHMKAVRAVLWAGLLAETMDRRGHYTDRTLSIVQVGDILADMDKPAIDELVEKIAEARGAAEPPPDPTTARVPPPPLTN